MEGMVGEGGGKRKEERTKPWQIDGKSRKIAHLHMYYY